MTAKPTALCLLHTPESVDILVAATARLGTAMGWEKILFVAIEEIPRHTPLEEFRRPASPLQIRQQQLLQYALDCADGWDIPCQPEGLVTHNRTYTLQQLLQKVKPDWVFGVWGSPTTWAVEPKQIKMKALRESGGFTGVQVQPGYQVGGEIGVVVTPDTLDTHIIQCASALIEPDAEPLTVVFLLDDSVPESFSGEEYAEMIIDRLVRKTTRPQQSYRLKVLPDSASKDELLTTLNPFDTLVMGGPHTTRFLERVPPDDLTLLAEQLASSLIIVHPPTED